MQHLETPVRQCAILVGGLGTRLGPIAASTPKPMLTCGDRPFLAWLMREFIRFGVRDFLLLTGHLSERVEAGLPAILATLPVEVTVRISREPVRAGTAGAVYWARHLLDERFFLCNGDSVFDGNLATLLADAGGAAAWIALRQVPDASRYGVVTLEGHQVTQFRPRPAAGAQGPGIINAGVYLLRRDALLPRLGETGSLEADVLPALAAQGALGGTLCEGYFIDIGIPEDFSRAQLELPARLRRPALFLDRDGVLNQDFGWVGTRDRFTWIDGAIEAVHRATAAGWHVFLVSNQSGVARGHYTEADVADLFAWIAETIRRGGGTIDDYRVCPYHPQAPLAAYRRESDCRKPAPGMLRDLIAQWELNPGQCLMIGDQPSDMQAAAAAGVPAHLFTGGNLCRAVAELLQTTGQGG